MRKKVLVANWKMNKLAKESADFIDELKKVEPFPENVEVVIAPPALFIERLTDQVNGTKIRPAAQNCFCEPDGAYTGEVSPAALEDLGVQFVIVGHSERREIFNESDALINSKIKSVYNQGMIPIICVGESQATRDAGQAKIWIEGQVRSALEGVKPEYLSKLYLAYEPIWAIGTGQTAEPKDAQDMIQFIRDIVFEVAGQEVSQNAHILYGGSVKPENIKEFMSQDDIDGALVGGASLEIDSFVELIKGVE